mmetsp:Transcript_32089/g.41121  ORF Transcript_32089/g.41121 Transcript_32089/m.41121 type:complete len:106 (-) Transcript_32089:32-349(-)
MWNYIFYKMYLDRKADTELNGMEAYLKALMENQSISYFPINQAMILENLEEKSDDMDSLKTEVNELSTKVEDIQKKMEDDRESLRTKIDQLTVTIKTLVSGNKDN